MTKPRVLVAQTGARHNYALPAAFADAGMLEAFYTDLCGGTGLGRLAEAAGALPLPGNISALASRLANRRPPGNVLTRTRTDGLATLRYELAARKPMSVTDRRNLLIDHTFAAGQRMARWGLGDATHVFNIFGYGGKLVEEANRRAIPVLADMMIALSTRRINLEEYAAFPEWGPEPADKSYSEMKGFNPDEHLLSTTDIFVCPSAFVADDLVENWDIDRSRTRIVPYALTGDWFDLRPQTLPGRILFAGSADRRKGIHYLAFAAQQLGKTFDFRVAGGVPDEVRARPEAQALHFLGRVPRSDMQDEFARADVFVLPTLAEGSATVIYEAMAAGLPVVTTHAAGSVIQNGVDGIIVPERDPGALAAAIEKITGDRALRGAMGQAARQNARHWNWQTYASSLREIVCETPSPIENLRSHRSTRDSGV